MGFMAINKGIAPPNLSTGVGQLRTTLGDVEYTALATEPGYGLYESFSDTELEGLLIQSGDSLSRATGFAYLKLSGAAAAQAVDWASDDQRVTLSKRATALLEVAKFWFDRADEEDAGAGSDAFAVEYPFGNRYDPEYVDPDYSIEQLREAFRW